MASRPRVLILHVQGTNRDRDVAAACDRAGGDPELVYADELATGAKRLEDYAMLVLPGGFSYGDDLGAGVLFSKLLMHTLAEPLREFIDSGRPVLGICNGFQALVKAGILPGPGRERATLTRNASNQFECRWVWLEPDPKSPCVFTSELQEPIACPVAHGEGRFAVAEPSVLDELSTAGQIALRYGRPDEGEPTYPWNPNGSDGAIAGVCNRQGNVLGLMPHPENHIGALSTPRRGIWADTPSGLPLFEAGIRYARV